MTLFRVQKLVTVKGGKVGGHKTAKWVTIATRLDRRSAEYTARHMKIDNPKSEVRIEEGAKH
jgi:hypothetical protein